MRLKDTRRQRAKDGGNFRKLSSHSSAHLRGQPAALVLGKKREVKAIEGLPQALGSSTVFLRGFYEGRSVPYLWLKPQKTEKGSEEPQKEQINSKHRALAYIQ